MAIKEVVSRYGDIEESGYEKALVVDLADWLDVKGSEVEADPGTTDPGTYWLILHERKQARRRARERRSTDGDAVRKLFEALRGEWLADTRYESSTTQIVTHRAYQRIIGLGPEALPLIFEDLEREAGPWYWALSAITGEDPAEGEVTVSGARTRWLEWADARGLLSSAAASG